MKYRLGWDKLQRMSQKGFKLGVEERTEVCACSVSFLALLENVLKKNLATQLISVISLKPTGELSLSFPSRVGLHKR